MTPAERQVRFQDRIRQLEFQLQKADYGMGMPRDYQRVLYLRQLLEEARKAAESDIGNDLRCSKCGQVLQDYRHICKPEGEQNVVKYTIKESTAGWNVYAEGGQLISNHHGRREAENAVCRYQAADKHRAAIAKAEGGQS